MKRTSIGFVFIVAPLVFSTWLTACASMSPEGTEGVAGAADEAIPSSERLEPIEIENWADETFGESLAEHRFSSLAISVTQGDQVILSKGYGYKDWATQELTDPDTSQFRIGSLSKTFLATAIAQLLERGRIKSLDDPVNKYLKRIQVENPFGGDVTIWDLLTHQGGFSRSPVFVPESTGPRPIPLLSADYIAEHIPDIAREPGKISIYCNPCSATLGFMVEDITGQTLENFLKKNVFEPLDMMHTSLTNDPDPGPYMVKQYAFVPGGTPVALSYPAISPYISYAGDINSTAGDMAKWLIAHIKEGRGIGPSILSTKTFELMHARHRGNHPDMSGFGMKFFTYDYNGERVLEHYGSIRFRSMEFLMLDRQIGVFVTMGGGGEPDTQLLGGGAPGLPPITGPVKAQLSHSGVRALVLEYFLGRLPIEGNMVPDLSKYTGLYQYIQADPNAPIIGPGRKVEDSGDGGLVIDQLGVYRPSGPNTFTLDRELPLEAGFRVSNKYVFTISPDGISRMFAHVNAGGFERVEPLASAETKE